jgi:hypothetical protein
MLKIYFSGVQGQKILRTDLGRGWLNVNEELVYRAIKSWSDRRHRECRTVFK